jgi:hypothetical protein
MQEISAYQRKQIGPRISRVIGTSLDCEAGYRLLAKASAGEQRRLIEHFMTATVDISQGVQRGRVAKRQARQIAVAKKLGNEVGEVLASLTDIMKDGNRLAGLCRALADRDTDSGPWAMAAQAFGLMFEQLDEAELNPGQRLLIAANTAEMLEAGLDPDAAPDAEDSGETQWSYAARTRQGNRYRDKQIDAPCDITADELERFQNV